MRFFGFSVRSCWYWTDVLALAKQRLLRVKHLSVSRALPMRNYTRSWEGAQPYQMTWMGHWKGIFQHHRTSCQHKLYGQLAERDQALPRAGVGIIQCVLSNCAVHHFFLLDFIPPSLSLFLPLQLLSLLLLLLLLLLLILSLLLTGFHLNLHVLLPFWLPSSLRASRWVAVWYLIADWVKPQHCFKSSLKIWTWVEPFYKREKSQTKLI